MIKKFFVVFLMASFPFLMMSCGSDDGPRELSIEERNTVDDEAIEQYLEDHYFGERGKIQKFETAQVRKTPSLLKSAIKDPLGYWYVIREDVVTNGKAIESNDKDSILISYNAQHFKATNDYDAAEVNQRAYATLSSYSSTINGSGLPIWDPVFYYKKLTAAEKEVDYKREYWEIEGFVDGLKHFKSTNTGADEIFNFQGVIIVPSRLAFARDFAYTPSSINQTNYRDFSFIFNFELHKVIDRKTE